MRSKSIRAEPVAAAYARGDVSHAGQFGTLEDQMCSCVPGQRQIPSPDRLDAMVWAVNALLGGIETATKEIAPNLVIPRGRTNQPIYLRLRLSVTGTGRLRSGGFAHLYKNFTLTGSTLTGSGWTGTTFVTTPVN